MRNSRGIFLLLVLLLLTLAPALEAQYFGRNKVQWENFDFKILRTEHFDIYYYEQEADVVHDIGRMAERWYARLSRVFNHSFTRKPIVLYANAADFHQTTIVGGLIGEGTGGFTDAFMNRVVLPLTGDYAANDHVLGHEIVHAFQYDIAATAQRNRRRFALEQLPLWLIEGMAEYLSKGRIDPLTAMWIRDATVHDRLPDIRQLSRDPRYFPYRYGQALMAYIGARFGDEAVVRYFMAAGVVGVEEAVERAIGINAKQLFADWQESARELYNPVVEVRDEHGAPLIGRQPVPGQRRRRRSTELNVAPAISPDGKHIAFLSARELFSIDLFLAETATGRVVRQLVSSQRDAHFDSLRFIESAGSWSPDGRRLAFVTYAKGDNFLSLVDVETRATEHIRVPGMEAIINVAWSPDGRTIALSGQTTGVSDLFLYDLESTEVRRLTTDKYADLQPAFSPDGRTIAFVTDRGPETSFENLQFGEKQLATIDVATGAIRLLPLFENAQHINPQWSPDGRSLYFIANPEGIPDIYRYALAGGSVARVTAVRTGVAGITDMSPALSVALRSGDIVFSLFEDDHYNIYTLPAATPGTQTALQMPAGTPRAAILPPLRGIGSEITGYLNAPEQGLPPEADPFEERPYSSALRLAYLGPPTIGASVGGGYNAIGGTVAAYFSDVLGRHNVGVTFQGSGGATNRISDQLAGEVFYLNQQQRFNWGGVLAHQPYVIPFYDYRVENVVIDGQPVTAEIYREIRQIQTFTETSALAQYPFSATRRVEGSTGYQRFAFKEEFEEFFFVGGQLADRRRGEFQGAFSVNLYTASAAFVGDSSTFGFISPVRGTRYRHEVRALAGDLNFQTALSDYRRYFYNRPVTFAMRGLHFGRYGQDAESQRLRGLYLGQGSLVRGYESWTFDVSECGANPQACPVFDRLVGTRLLAGSVEVRAPLLGPPGFGLIPASFLPTEIFAFGDVGAAWRSGESVSWQWNTNTNARVPVASAGLGLRILLSYIPIEVFAAKPFHRPQEQLVYGFNITPGW
ncbi:MAG TPA: BamA/TamA family outer membrane protein [Thermoanaerobaculia bacterium]|nr:BamA/TamA family outer membrane protein [Thermoanaerobaculia bacterium]